METLEQEVPTEIDRDSLLESAYKADVAEGIETDDLSTPKEADRAAAEEQAKPEAKTEGNQSSETKSDPQKEARERDAAGRFKPKAEAEVKPDSEYSKAKKNQEREQTLLKNFQAEKDKARAEIEAERQAIAQEKAKIQQVQAQQRPEATKDGFSAREYWQAAKEFEKAGDFEAAHKAMNAFIEVRNYEAQAFRQASSQQSHQAYEQAWQGQMNKSFSDDPETDPNSGSKLSGVIANLLEAYPESFYLKDGFMRIVKTAKGLVDADSVSELRTKLEKAQADLEGFHKSTTPAKGGPNSVSSPKNFENMSSEEMRDHLIRQSEIADSQAA